MWKKHLRVLGAIFAVILTAAACGSESTTTDTAADGTASDEAQAEEAMSEDDAKMDPDMADMEEMEDIEEGHDHGDDHGEEAGDDHGDDHAKTIDVDPSNPVPEVAVILNETDTPGLFDMRVVLANFTITPENVDGDPVDNEGHMHLLIDGEKVERFYELERQVTVPEGEHLVEVELNANNHAAYAIDGQPIRSGMTVTGAGEAADGGHDHGDHSDAAGAIEEGLTAADADVTITAALDGGSISLDGDERVEVSVDDVVMVTITSDVAEQAHVHGYDILADVGPDADGTILFTADTPGRFEIEFETSGAFIAELVVS